MHQNLTMFIVYLFPYWLNNGYFYNDDFGLSIWTAAASLKFFWTCFFKNSAIRYLEEVLREPLLGSTRMWSIWLRLYNAQIWLPTSFFHFKKINTKCNCRDVIQCSRSKSNHHYLPSMVIWSLFLVHTFLRLWGSLEFLDLWTSKTPNSTYPWSIWLTPMLLDRNYHVHCHKVQIRNTLLRCDQPFHNGGK